MILARSLHVKNITQPGQFAAEEMVTLVTERSMMDLRVIGPLREKTQIELSMTDARAVGLTPPIRNSVIHKAHLEESLLEKLVWLKSIKGLS